VSEEQSWLLEIRLFTLNPGTRDEWHRISRDGTTPLMRKLGINVVAYGPSLNNEDGYYLIRAFASEQERTELGASLYEQPEWDEQYDAPLSAMMADYHTAVLQVPQHEIEQLAAALSAG
jgi:hypothetical protein